MAIAVETRPIVVPASSPFNLGAFVAINCAH